MTMTAKHRTYEEHQAHRAAMLETFDTALVEMLHAVFENPADVDRVLVGCTSDSGGISKTARREWGERLTPRTDEEDQPVPWTDRQIDEHAHELARLALFDWFRPTIARSDSGVAFGQMRRIELGLREFIAGR